MFNIKKVADFAEKILINIRICFILENIIILSIEDEYFCNKNQRCLQYILNISLIKKSRK